jgi:radical SAM protein with 4Fe4S-binding SPASM domain
MSVKYQLKEASILRSRGEDEGVLVNLNREESIFVNGLGFSILQMIESGICEIDNIVAKLLSIYDSVAESEIRGDVVDFLSSSELSGYIDQVNEDAEFDNKLSRIQLELTTACNERCVHCYIPNSKKNECASLSKEILTNVISDFAKIGGKHITLSGGEPLLSSHFDYVIDLCSKFGIEVVLLSNLTLLTQEKLDYILQKVNLVGVQVSFYSMDSVVHDSITQKNGSWEKTYSAIRMLHEKNIKVTISCPIMRENKDSVSELLAFARQNDIQIRANAAIIARTDGDESFVKSSALSHEEYSSLFRQLVGKHGKYAHDVIFEGYNKSNDLCDNTCEFINSNVCSAAGDNLSITAFGDVLPCPSWNSYVLGNVKNNSLKDIWENSPKLKLIRRLNKWKNFPVCLKCNYLDNCKFCLMQNASKNMGEMLDVDPMFCELAKLSKELKPS